MTGRRVRIPRAPRGYVASWRLRDCPKCSAKAGHPCQRWKTDKGERVYVLGPKATICPERKRP